EIEDVSTIGWRVEQEVIGRRTVWRFRRGHDRTAEIVARERDGGAGKAKAWRTTDVPYCIGECRHATRRQSRRVKAVGPVGEYRQTAAASLAGDRDTDRADYVMIVDSRDEPHNYNTIRTEVSAGASRRGAHARNHIADFRSVLARSDVVCIRARQRAII